MMSSIGYRRHQQRRLLPNSQSMRLAVLLSVILHTITISIAQNAAMSSTVPTLVRGGALAAAANPLSNCSNVKSLFEAQGINGVDIPTQPTSGKFHLYLFCVLILFFHSYRNFLCQLRLRVRARTDTLKVLRHPPPPLLSLLLSHCDFK